VLLDEPRLEDARDRLSRLFQFLQGLQALRTPTPRVVAEADFSFWLDQLPAHEAIERGWQDDDAEFVLRVSRPSLTECPRPPMSVVGWLVSGWERLDGSVATLETREPPHIPSSPASDLLPERFEDDPARVAQLQSWQQVRDLWVDRERPAREAMRVFERLYGLYGALRRDGGQFDLLVGDAILEWRAPALEVHYPLILQSLQLDLEAEYPRLTITSSESPPALNTDLLRAIDQVDGRVLAPLTEEFNEGGYGPFSGEEMHGFLRGIASRLHQHGAFLTETDARPNPGAPVITRRSLFITRPRSAGIAAALAAICEDIQWREEFPGALLAISGLEIEAAAEPDGDLAPNGLANEDPVLLFTKPANEEQARIARRLERHDAVIVQGPPGTGKTHTIANLIGHLLAQGKRILVTSHTSKALERVREVITDDLRPLAVSVLNNDLAGRAQLEESVRTITDHLSSESAEHLREEALRLRQERDTLLTSLQVSRERLRAAVLSEYRDVVIGGVATDPSRAAQEIRAGVGINDWIPAPVSGDTSPLSTEEIQHLYRTNVTVPPDDEREIAARLPALEDIWVPDRFEAAVSDESDLERSDTTTGASAWTSEGATPDLVALEAIAAEAERAASDIRGLAPWELEILEAGIRGGGFRDTWDNLLTQVAEADALAEVMRPLAARLGPELPTAMTPEECAVIFGRIRSHLESGGTLGRLTLLTHRDWARALTEARVAHGTTRDTTAVEALEVLARLTVQRRYLAGMWERLVEGSDGPSAASLGVETERGAEQHVGRIRRLLDWSGAIWAPLLERLSGIGLDHTALMEQVSPQEGKHGSLLRLCELAGNLTPRVLAAKHAALRLARVTRELGERADLLARFDDGRRPRDAVPALRRALAERDAVAYRQHFERLVELHERSADARFRSTTLAALESAAPAWGNVIRAREGAHGAGMPPGDVAAAWRWRRLSEELAARAAESPDAIQATISELESRLRDLTGQLVSTLAWASQIERTSTSQRQDLVGWMNTMRRVGKGTGKNAPRLLAEARRLMASSRSAVPVWIMPLTRVAETFDPRSTTFDVVVIDEASQSDMLALIALYLGKQIVIVGDHEQVSPDAVGQNLEPVQRLIDQYLAGIPNGHLYDGRRSIYDAGMEAFGGVVQLREHFRCVPDIIEFSNRLSYSGTILPLRDASRVTRRPFVVAQRVDGLRRGYTNQQEAEFIASAILACCELPEYDGATFGVIVLLGTEQARLIDTLLRQRITPAEFEARRVLVGTPPQFQGDERDVIFLSVVDSPGEGPLRMQQREEFKKRYNVAASRARDQMWVVHSLSPERDLQQGDLRRELIQHAMDPRAHQTALAKIEARAESPFESAVAEALVRAGFEVHAQHEVGAYRIDLVVTGAEGRRVALECDGERYHTPENLGRDLARQALLERLGWRFVRIRGSEYYRDPEATMDRAIARLAQFGVRTGASELETTTLDDNGLRERVIRRAEAIRTTWQEQRVDS
jgi:very-short-patch-repair endonuclease